MPPGKPLLLKRKCCLTDACGVPFAGRAEAEISSALLQVKRRGQPQRGRRRRRRKRGWQLVVLQ